LGARWELLLVDADVLIDYVVAEVTILGRVARHVGSVYVVRSVLAEVEGLDADQCTRLGIEIVEPSVDQLLEAGAEPRGRLSFNDRVSLIVAAEAGWTCVSNDRALRRACGDRQVQVWWGLHLLLALVRDGALDRDAALAVARAIHESNPLHITREIVERFVRELSSAVP
jgi:predicted nucleic acid-binding protein